MTPDAQESRTEKTAIALTSSEKIALVVVARDRDIPEAHLLREMLIHEIVEEHERLEYERLQQKFRREPAADAAKVGASAGHGSSQQPANSNREEL